MSRTLSATAPSPPTTGAPVLRLRAHAMNPPGPVALREKDLGLWRDITWPEYWQKVTEVANALLALGIGPGERVAVHSENRPAWVYSDYGTQAVRAASVGLYPTNPTAEVGYLLADCGARVLVAEDQEQVDKVLAIPPADLPALEHIVYIEPRGVRDYDDPRLMDWVDFLQLGRQHAENHPNALDERLAAIDPDDLAIMVYTSGTTGPPKGAMLSVRNLEYAVEAAGMSDGLFDPPAGPGDILLSYLPLCHVYERLLTCLIGTSYGVTVHFAESIETVQADLAAVQPTVFATVPRILEKAYSGVQVRMATASRLKRLNFAIWSKVAEEIAVTKVANNGQHTPVTRILQFLGDIFLYRALKERLGLRRCRAAVSGAAPIAPEILQWFMGLGVPIVEAYGQTEGTAIATANRLDNVKLGTVGTPYGGTEVRLDPDTGEIQIRHGGLFAGYWNRHDATADTIDAEGWLHTGDVGEWDGEHLKIVDRLKDIIITSGGKNISPSEIENSLKTSPYIKEAMVVGEGRKFLSALIGIELDTVGDWATRRNIPYTTYRDLSEKPEVLELVGGIVDETNKKFARAENIRKFRMIPKELDHEDGELTATQKLKRSAMVAMFHDLIEEMYSS